MSVVKKLPLQSNLWKPLVELLDQLGVMTPKAVADFFAGSLKTAEACQKLGRRFRCSDQSLAYLQGGASNLISNAGFVDLTAGLFSKFE